MMEISLNTLEVSKLLQSHSVDRDTSDAIALALAQSLSTCVYSKKEIDGMNKDIYNAVKTVIDAEFEKHFEKHEARINARLDRLESNKRWSIGIFVTVLVGVFSVNFDNIMKLINFLFH